MASKRPLKAGPKSTAPGNTADVSAPRVGRPAKNNRRLNVYIGSDLYEDVRDIAERRRMTYSALVELYLEMGVNRDRKRLEQAAEQPEDYLP
ncbi:MAG: hypothetical protein KA712_00165 [Myxococcales bacterium]|nr:hypothetical protein [Myxococcales bacterium]